MTAKNYNSDRKRSRPVEKPSISTKMKRNKTIVWSLLLVITIVVAGVSSFLLVNNQKDDDVTPSNKNNPIAVINTSAGIFKMELFIDKVPITAGNFLNHAKSGYYNGIIFHRVIPNFMIQGGDPLGTGGGGHAAEYHEGYGDSNNPDTWLIPDEFDEELSNVRGTISMANRGPNTGGSQFFINVVDNTNLDYDKQPLTSKHAVFGKVIDGMNVVDAISNVETGANDKPKQDVIINNITIE